MNNFIREHTYAFLLTVEKFRSFYPADFQPTWIRTTTIPVTAKFPVESFDKKVIEDLFDEVETIDMGKNQIWRRVHNNFMHSVSIGFTDHLSDKAIKVFCNGSVQICGGCDLFDAYDAICQTTDFLNTIYAEQFDHRTIDFQVNNINSTYSLGYTINILELTMCFAECSIFRSVEFNPDRYSAVKIKFRPAEDMKAVVVSIFGTGSVIITGARTLKEIVFAYNIINHHIITHREKLLVKPHKTPPPTVRIDLSISLYFH